MYRVAVLHFDDTYFYQDSLRKYAIEVDLRFLKGIKFLCLKDKLSLIENQITKKINQIKSMICFIGKGEYHYISYLLMKRICIPFCLFVIDNHLDMRYCREDLIRCDSWIYRAGKIKNLKWIFFINSLSIDRVPKIGFPVYLSIDKDILDKKYLNTRWTQGKACPSELFRFLVKFSSVNEILAVDICGEPEIEDLKEMKKSEKINISIIECFGYENLKKSA